MNDEPAPQKPAAAPADVTPPPEILAALNQPQDAKFRPVQPEPGKMPPEFIIKRETKGPRRQRGLRSTRVMDPPAPFIDPDNKKISRAMKPCVTCGKQTRSHPVDDIVQCQCCWEQDPYRPAPPPLQPPEPAPEAAPEPAVVP